MNIQTNNENNFFVIDKPLWITSFDVIFKLRKKFQIKRMWHAWTLDPLASGLLLIATGNYTKLLSSLILQDKVYEFTVAINGTSPSFDLWTEVTYISEAEQERAKNKITLDFINTLLKNHFTGNIKQIPPKYSAIKVGWQRAYDKIRGWDEDFELKEKEVTIHSIKVISFEYPFITMKAHVSSGTYIRSIARDLGELLWTGWYITYLRRTKIHFLDESLAATIDEVDFSKNLPITVLFPKTVTLPKEIISELNFWRSVEITDKNIYDEEENFVLTDWYISHIIKVQGNILSPIRKII